MSVVTAEDDAPSTVEDDYPSLQGRYAWCVFKNIAIPCLLRSSGARYISKRMAERTIMKFFLESFKAEVFDCINVGSLYVTAAEVELLNRINSNECNFSYGHEPFVCTDTLVRYEDLIKLDEFLELCYLKVTLQTVWFNKFGYIYVNDLRYIVTYVLSNDETYIPLYCFEGDVEYLRSKSIYLEKWEAVYLKFLLSMQSHNYQGDLFPSDQCLVVNLKYVKECLPPQTKYTAFWPIDAMHGLTLRAENDPICQSWVRAPTGAIPVPSSSAVNISQDPKPSSVVYLNQRAMASMALLSVDIAQFSS